MGAQFAEQGGLRTLFNLLQDNPNVTKTYLNGIDPNRSMVNDMLSTSQRTGMQNNVPGIDQLFPQLAQSQYLQPQKLEPTVQPLISYGAGRFLDSTK
jgi:hypothetical protein